MEEHILICDDDLEGILTGVYTAYERHYKPEQTRIQTSDEGNLRLFADYERVESDGGKSRKVMRTLAARFGEEGLYTFCLALASTDEERATSVYRTIAKGLRLSRPAAIFDRHADPDVWKVEKLKCCAWHEMHRLFGFVRFREWKGGILFSEIHPKNNVLPFLAEHFADRFPMEHFLIRDAGRGLFAVHEAGKQWFLAENVQFTEKRMEESVQEEAYEELFRYFCNKITVEARKNEKLQKSMLPLRFRPDMTEFADGGQK